MANTEFNSFIKGYVSDANPLNYPENTSLDEENMVLNKDGSRNRRLGLSFDNNSRLDFSNVKFYNTYIWENVGNSNMSYLIVQLDNRLLAYLITGEEFIIDNPTLNETVSNYVTGYFNFTSGGGNLFVCNESVPPFIISYKDGSFSITNISIKIRDFFGVDDGIPINENPPILTGTHLYNLLNNGWPGGNEEYKIDKSRSVIRNG